MNTAERYIKRALGNTSFDYYIIGDVTGKTTEGIPAGYIRVSRYEGGAYRSTKQVLIADADTCYYVPVPGYPVIVTMSKYYNEEVIKGTDTFSARALGFDIGFVNPGNPTYNNAWVKLQNATLLLALPRNPADLKLDVMPYNWLDSNGTWHGFPGEKDVDLTAAVGALSGDQRQLAVLYLKDDETIEIELSSVVEGSESLNQITNSHLQECQDTAPANSLPVAAYIIRAGMTEITWADRWGDIRQWINAPFDTSGLLTDAVILAPGSSTRNLITPTGNFSNLVLRANSGTQSEPMLELQTEAGSGFFRIYRLNGLTANLMTLSGKFRIDGLDLDGSTLSTHQTNQDLSLTPNGTGKVIVGGDGLTVDTDLIIADASANTVDMVGAVGITGDLDVDNVNVNGNTISTTDTNGNLNLTPNGTGKVNIGADGLIVDTDLMVADASANTVDMVAAVGITGDLDVDNVNINGNTISTTDTNGNLNLTPNGTGKVNIGADGLIIDTDLMIADASANTVDFVGAVNVSGDLSVDSIELDGSIVHTEAESGAPTFRADGYAVNPTFVGRRAQGTKASPTVAATGAALIQFQAQGWDGSAFALGGVIRALATEDYDGSGRGTKWEFLTTPNNSTTAAVAMTVEQNGNVTAENDLTVDDDLTVTGDTNLNGILVGNRTIVSNNTYAGYDVAGKIILAANTGSGNVDFQGFANGVSGQIIYVYKGSSANSLIFRHNHASGTQKILTAGSADVTLGAGYGLVTLVCDGTQWFLRA